MLLLLQQLWRYQGGQACPLIQCHLILETFALRDLLELTNPHVPVAGPALTTPNVRPFLSSEASPSYAAASVGEYFARTGASTFGMSDPGWLPSCPFF